MQGKSNPFRMGSSFSFIIILQSFFNEEKSNLEKQFGNAIPSRVLTLLCKLFNWEDFSMTILISLFRIYKGEKGKEVWACFYLEEKKITQINHLSLGLELLKAYVLCKYNLNYHFGHCAYKFKFFIIILQLITATVNTIWGFNKIWVDQKIKLKWRRNMYVKKHPTYHWYIELTIAILSAMHNQVIFSFFKKKLYYHNVRFLKTKPRIDLVDLY